MRFDKGEKEEIRKTQLECVHPHYSYFLYYSELKGVERGECRQGSNFPNRKDEVGFESLWRHHCHAWTYSDPQMISWERIQEN